MGAGGYRASPSPDARLRWDTRSLSGRSGERLPIAPTSRSARPDRRIEKHVDGGRLRSSSRGAGPVSGIPSDTPRGRAWMGIPIARWARHPASAFNDREEVSRMGFHGSLPRALGLPYRAKTHEPASAHEGSDP